MNSNRNTAIIVGALFIIGWVAGVLSAVITGPILNDPDYLLKFSANEYRIITAALLVLIMGFALVMVPVMMFPIFKKRNEALALGYVAFRALEAGTYIALVISWLLLLTLSQEYVKAGAPSASYFQTLGTLLLGAANLSQLNTIFVFGLGALIFYYLLYQSKLIPRFISVWGLIGATLHLAAGLLQIFGLTAAFSSLEIFMSLPIALNELFLATWLIAKGFNSSAIATEYAKTDTNRV